MAHDPLVGLLRSFRLPTMASIYARALEQAESQNWGYRRFLQHLCESEAQDRRQRRLERLLKDSGLPAGKSLENLDQTLLPAKIRRQLPTLLEGGFVTRAENVLIFGLPGRGKTHLMAAVARELVLRHGHAVLFVSTFKLVQQLLAAKKALRLDACLKKLDRYAVVCLDDLGYVQQDREEMEVLFTFLAERYERRSVMLTSNLVFSQWDRIFKDPMTTMAAVDRLVHHSTILEADGQSVRVQKAQTRPPD
jgi:DNA replication protein DnaC